MKLILKEVESGQFANQFIDEYENNKFKNMLEMRKAEVFLSNLQVKDFIYAASDIYE